jgi:hypothetical protein
MKKFNKVGFTSSLLFSLISLAAPQGSLARETSPDWAVLRSFVQSCAVQPYAVGSRGRKILGSLRSICPELEVEAGKARFVLEGKTYEAHLSESAYSDGGDLNELEVRTPEGTTLLKAAPILAFGDILLALALGDDRFPEIEDDTLLER